MSSACGPPWTRIITGCGPAPSGCTRNPCTRCPFGFVNHHVSKSRPAGADGPSATSSGVVVPASSSTAVCSPLCPRYHTAPSGRTAAAVIEPGSVSSAVTSSVTRSYRYRRCRPASSWSSRRADPSGHQSAGSTAPARSRWRSRTSPVSRSQIAGRRSPLRSCAIAIRRSPDTGENPNPASASPSSRSSAIVRPVSASRARSAGWSTSPSSMTSSTTTRSSDDSAPRSTDPARPQPPARRMGWGCSWSRRTGAPSSETQRL